LLDVANGLQRGPTFLIGASEAILGKEEDDTARLFGTSLDPSLLEQALTVGRLLQGVE
jgi:hypothetical protein